MIAMPPGLDRAAVERIVREIVLASRGTPPSQASAVARADPGQLATSDCEDRRHEGSSLPPTRSASPFARERDRPAQPDPPIRPTTSVIPTGPTQLDPTEVDPPPDSVITDLPTRSDPIRPDRPPAPPVRPPERPGPTLPVPPVRPSRPTDRPT